MHYFKPYNRPLVLAALKQAGREDLIGWGPECLITPYERRQNDGVGRSDSHERKPKADKRPAKPNYPAKQRKGQTGGAKKHPDRGGRRK